MTDTAVVESFAAHLRGELRHGFVPFGLVICAVLIGAVVVARFPWGPILLGVVMLTAVYGSYRRWQEKRASY